MGVLAGSWPRVECIGGRRGNPEQRESVAAMTANGTTANGGQEGEKVAPPPEKGSWTIGLINSRFKYLSAETFGFKINANGKAMKKKQVWILEPYGDGDSICLRSHMHKFLAVDQFGNVTCENEEKDDTAKFEISVCDDFSGRWAFRSVTRGYFLGASADNLVCSVKRGADGDPGGGERALGQRYPLHPRVQGGGKQVRDSHEQQPVSDAGRQTCAGAVEGLSVCLRVPRRLHRAQGPDRTLSFSYWLSGRPEDQVKCGHKGRAFLPGRLPAPGKLPSSEQPEICVDQAR